MKKLLYQILQVRWILATVNWFYRPWYRWQTNRIVKNINKMLPKLVERMARAGYNRAQRRDTMRKIIKGLMVKKYGEEL